MAAYVNANNAFSTLAGNISASDTSFTLTVGGSFPVVTAGNWSYVTFQDTANNIEIMKVTLHGDGTNSFQCVRAQEGTPARAWIVGDFVECRFTAGTVCTLDGVQTLTNKTILSPTLRFADGTLSSPGMAWQNEPTTGFTRIGSTIMAVSINTQNVMQWQPSATIFNAPAYFSNGNSLNFYNASGAGWEVLHANNANNLYVGRVGWVNTYLYGGGAANIHIHGGGVAFAGNITGINAGHVGLGNLQNHRQVYELRNGGAAVYIGWDGGMLDCQVNSTYFGRNWPINISGTAAACSGNAGTASTAANALNICNIGGWRYANMGKNPAYLWASDGSTQDQFLVQPGNLTVNRANSASYADSAGSTNSISGVGLGNLVRSNDGSLVNAYMYDDQNESVYIAFQANRNLGGPQSNTYSIRLWSYGPTMATATETVKAREVDPAADETSLLTKAFQELAARVEALEARLEAQ